MSGVSPLAAPLTASRSNDHFVWCAIIPTPLFLSCDIERIDGFTLSLVTNDDLIEIQLSDTKVR